jgi:hypothetical protein
MSMQHRVGTSVFGPAAGWGPRVQRLRWPIAGIALALSLAACSSNDSSAPTQPIVTPPPPAVISISGLVDDAFVDNATLTAYPVSASGVVGQQCLPPATGSGSCATATTDSNDAYTLTIGGNYSGAVLLESTGGSYTDTVTGQTVPIPAGLTLSTFLPSVAAGTSYTAQITGFTTLAAQLALQAMSQGASAASAATTAATDVQNAFGFTTITPGGTETLATTLLNLAAPNCGTAAADQASFDVSLLLAGIAQLASQNGVTSADLMSAIIEDIASDWKADGLKDGVPILVPLASGSSSVALTAIYAEGLALSLEASIKVFQSSVADACQATQSQAQSTALTSAPSTLSSEQYQYTATGTVSGLTAGTKVTISFSLGLTCTGDMAPDGGVPSTGPIPDSVNGPFSLSVGGSNSVAFPVNYSNSCATNTGTVQVSATGGQTCLVASSSGGNPAANTTFTFASATNSSGDETDTASGIAITCSPPPPTLYTVGGTVSLPAGASVTILDTVNGDQVIVNAPVNAPGTTFTLPAQLGNGTGYQVTASAGAANTCTVSNASGTINGASVTNVAVACSSTVAPAALQGPRGIEFHNNLLFVPNYTSSQVLLLSEQTNSSNQVTGLTQVASIPTTHLNQPARAAFDASGNLYVANQGNSGVTGSQSVTVYNPNFNYAEITASGGGALISGVSLTGPIGVAVDSHGNVYVTNDPGDTISVFIANNPGVPSAGFTEANFSPLHNDGAGTSFATPLMIVDENVPGGLGEYVFVGLSQNPTSRILVYSAPLTATPMPIYDLAGVAGCTMPAGPTGIALYGTSLYAASSYDTEIFQYAASTLIGGGSNPCVAPSAINGTGMSGVEGVAVDSFGNVFVANADANTITVYAGSSFGSSEAPIYTYNP